MKKDLCAALGQKHVADGGIFCRRHEAMLERGEVLALKHRTGTGDRGAAVRAAALEHALEKLARADGLWQSREA